MAITPLNSQAAMAELGRRVYQGHPLAVLCQDPDTARKLARYSGRKLEPSAAKAYAKSIIALQSITTAAVPTNAVANSKSASISDPHTTGSAKALLNTLQGPGQGQLIPVVETMSYSPPSESPLSSKSLSSSLPSVSASQMRTSLAEYSSLLARLSQLMFGTVMQIPWWLDRTFRGSLILLIGLLTACPALVVVLLFKVLPHLAKAMTTGQTS